MNKNERRFISKGLYWTIVPILFVLIVSGCLGLMNIANTLCFIAGLVGVIAAILYLGILVKREVSSWGQSQETESKQ